MGMSKAEHYANTLRRGEFYTIKFYDRVSGTTKTRDGILSRIMRLGIHFEIFENMGFTEKFIYYNDIINVQN